MGQFFVAGCKELLARARRSPTSLRFPELCRLAECHGFEVARQRGSHRVYKRSGYLRVMTFQNDKGKAKAYQVRQLVNAIEEIDGGDRIA